MTGFWACAPSTPTRGSDSNRSRFIGSLTKSSQREGCLIVFLALGILIVIVSDLEHMVILDEVLGVFGIILLVEICIINGFNDALISVLNGFLAFLTMLIIKKIGDYFFKRESMGGGDIKLMFLFAVS